MVVRNYSDNHIDVDVQEVDGFVWRFTGVYGFPQTETKHRTWTLLKDLRVLDTINRPWLCPGDFNEIIFQYEKEGGCLRPQAQMDSFREAIDFCDLHDLGYEGDIFTWRNQQTRAAGYIRERLDRALANEGWRQKFPTVVVQNGDPRHSDHRPVIIITDRPLERGPGAARSFSFEAGWLEEEKCEEVVMEGWEQGVAEGLCKVDQLVRKVAGGLNSWSSNVLGAWEKQKKEAKKGVGALSS